MVCSCHPVSYIQPVRLLVSTSPNQPTNSVFLSQQTSISQSKPAQKPTSEQADYVELISQNYNYSCLTIKELQDQFHNPKTICALSFTQT